MFTISNTLRAADDDGNIDGAPQVVHIGGGDGRGQVTVDGVPIPGVIAQGGVVLTPGNGARQANTLQITFLVGDVHIGDEIAPLVDLRLPVGSDSGVYFADADDTQPFQAIDLDDAASPASLGQ